MEARFGVWRPIEGRLKIRMPYVKDRFAEGNRAWLKRTLGSRVRIEYDKEEGYWLVARSHFSAIVEALAQRRGRIDVYIDFRGVERCDTRCKNARGRECDCSCLGKTHGQGVTYGWRLVGDTTEVLSTGLTRRHVVVVRGAKNANL